jgi:plasmid maintenance system killer protein
MRNCRDYRKAFLDNRKPLPYKVDMIRSFRDKTLERFFATGDGRRLSVQNTKRIANILRSLDDASRPEDMNLPGSAFMRSLAAIRDATRSAPAETGAFHSVGSKAMQSTSIWKTITED